MVSDHDPQGTTAKQIETLRELVDQVKQGDLDAVPALRRLLHQERRFWQHAADVAARAREAQLDLIAGDDAKARQAVEQKMEDLKSQLAGPSPTAIERVLIDRLAVCWLHVFHADLMYSHARDVDAPQVKFFEDRLRAAERRFLFAAKQLEMVRRLVPGGSDECPRS